MQTYSSSGTQKHDLTATTIHLLTTCSTKRDAPPVLRDKHTALGTFLRRLLKQLRSGRVHCCRAVLCALMILAAPPWAFARHTEHSLACKASLLLANGGLRYEAVTTVLVRAPHYALVGGKVM